MKRTTYKIAASLIACLCALATQSVKANSINYTLNTPNTSISGYTGPYATVNVNLTDSTHATITFTGNTVGGNTFLFGGAQFADVNVNATTFSLVVLLPGSTTGYSSQNVSGFGKFNAAIDNFDGNGFAVSSVSFTLTDTSSTWADAANVLTADDAGYSAAAHIFVRNVTGGNPATGFAGNGSNPPVVPDGGSTMALLGLALAGLGSVRRLVSSRK
jgi:hypothetical protein